MGSEAASPLPPPCGCQVRGTQCPMNKPIAAKFSVRPEDETAAIDHLLERGFAPTAIETDSRGLKVLIFPPLPDDRMHSLALALPVHLSAKIGIVTGGRSPFAPVRTNDR